MHRAPKAPRFWRLRQRISDTYRKLTGLAERRALDEWCAAIERDLAARPWVVCYA